MNYQGSQLLPHPAERVWQALLDPAVLRQCIAGCETFERVGDDAYNSTVKIVIGPVSARFSSTVTLADVTPPTSCTLRFAGQGGVAGFGKGEARVVLTPEGEGTRLDWNADAHVGGRLAQIGSRLIDVSVKKMSGDFFERFAAQLNTPVVDAGAVTAPASVVSPPKPAGSAFKAVRIAIALVLAAAMAWWLSR
ncbi:MAG: carbon monoxide dehydrogenase subunit G [Pseudomonadota bacterium]|nr:carbon monoxide dehydrogenase subunit G [Pseudomonadota bacterium]